MKRMALIGGLLIALGAHAQGFQDEPTCYSWNGGYKSSGSFTKCNPELKAPVKATVPTPTPVVVTPVAPTPLMMPTCVNPVAEPVKAKPRPKPRPKPKAMC